VYTIDDYVFIVLCPPGTAALPKIVFWLMLNSWINLVATIDVIIPFFNEASSAPELCKMLEGLSEHFLKNGLHTNLILVDDGSIDGSSQLFADTLRITATIIELSRNFGKEIAVLAGLDASSGEYALIMDADLQHSSSVAIKMVDHLLVNPTLDMVFARRNNREQNSKLAKYGARAFYRLINWGQHYSFPENAGDFRVMRRPVVVALQQLRDQRRFNKGLYAFAGYQQYAIDYTPEPRNSGQGKWSRLQLLGYSLSAFTSFSILPLRILSGIGILGALLAIVYGIKIIFEVVYSGVAVPGFPSLFVAVTFLGGLNLALLGLIGEYVWVGVLESKNRPVYLVRNIKNISLK
jgi:polyisoprenyl-phosphate glycosyltransferase